jgi:hypothetical protein
MSKSINYDVILSEKLKDPDFKAAYDALESRFALDCKLVDARIVIRQQETSHSFHISVEQGDNGEWVLSEDIALNYAYGKTLPDALRDLASTIEEYCAITKANAEAGDYGEKEMWELVKGWVE